MFDTLLAHAPRHTVPPPLAVVDIDRRAIEEIGPWPWPRERLAALVDAIAASSPKAAGLDILIEGPDPRSPKALARALAEMTGNREIGASLAALEDGDAKLAAAVKRAPLVLGLALDPEQPGEAAASAPVLTRGVPDLAGAWHAAGVIGPQDALAEAAAGLGVLSLPGDADGLVRRVPLLTITPSGLRPSLTAELLRLHETASLHVAADNPQALHIGPLALPIASDAMVRLVPPHRDAATPLVVPALDLLRNQASPALKDKLVLIGSSAPEAGGLRPSAGGQLLPSLALHAQAIAQALSGDLPLRPDHAGSLEMVGAALLMVVAAWLGLKLAPWRGSLAVAGLAFVWIAAALAALAVLRLLVDPVGPPALAGASFALAALTSAAATRRREGALRRRFEQHLAPEIVARIVRTPDLLKLEGEMREVTVLFTDVEGFTSMTERSEPTDLVSALDRYFEEMTRIVVAHGGMVEKMVGDGLHALFNAPLDLPAHADAAVRCAAAIAIASDRYRSEPLPQRLGFGRTRIGIETGRVVVGDVGGGGRLDYTAYGDAMNTAARLEAANKELGSTICIGPTTAASLADRSILRPLGTLAVRGRSQPLAIFEPWPSDLDTRARQRHSDALALAPTDPARAARMLLEIAASRPGDLALARLIARIDPPATFAEGVPRAAPSAPTKAHKTKKSRRR